MHTLQHCGRVLFEGVLRTYGITKASVVIVVPRARAGAGLASTACLWRVYAAKAASLSGGMALSRRGAAFPDSLLRSSEARCSSSEIADNYLQQFACDADRAGTPGSPQRARFGSALFAAGETMDAGTRVACAQRFTWQAWLERLSPTERATHTYADCVACAELRAQLKAAGCLLPAAAKQAGRPAKKRPGEIDMRRACRRSAHCVCDIYI